MSTDRTERIRLDELNQPEGEQDPRISRKEGHRDDLAEIFNREGFVNPLIISEADYLIVDGNYRADVLESLSEQDEKFSQLEVIGRRDGYIYALPRKEIEIDPERASMELNLYRENNSQADCARFLKYLIETRIIESTTHGVNDDATASKLLIQLEHHRQRGDEWKHSEEVKSLLDRFMADLNFESVGSARTYLNYLNNSPQSVQEAWGREEIDRSHVEHLKELAKHTDEIELEKYVEGTANDKFSVRDLDEIKKELQDEETGPEDIDEDEFEQFTKEEVSQEDRERAERVADWYETSPGKILKQCYQLHNEGRDFRQELTEAVDEIEELERELAKREEERRQALENFDFSTDSRFAKGDADHRAPPIETENFGVFFHDCLEMDDEIEDESVQLFLTSPPYYEQRGTIPDGWPSYADYLDDMIERFEKMHSKLESGRYMVLVISDTMVDGILHDIPSDFSYFIRHELKQKLGELFHLEASITWDKTRPAKDRNGIFHETRNPLDYYPNWQTERLLVWRKGEKTKDEQYTVDPEQFRDYLNEIWQIPVEKDDSRHVAGFPTELAKIVVQLYSYPGDTIADPFLGYGTTLEAVRQLNSEASEDTRQGFGWENFISEDGNQQDYRKKIELHVGESTLSPFVT